MKKNIYIIHENDEWLIPLRESFKKIKAPFKEWHMDKVSFDFNQEVFVSDTLVTQAKIQCGCLDSKKFTPSSLPEYLHNGMKKLI